MIEPLSEGEGGERVEVDLMVERGRARVAQRQQRRRRRDAGGAREVECSHRRAAAELGVADEEDRPAGGGGARDGRGDGGVGGGEIDRQGELGPSRLRQISLIDPKSGNRVNECGAGWGTGRENEVEGGRETAIVP